MRVPLSWLKEFIDIESSPVEIAKILTMGGLEVEGLEKVSLSFTQVVVAKIIKVEKHPNAEKLCLAEVTDGTETFRVVCGASNCREGIKTAFAPIGATLSDGKGGVFAIKKAKLRGEESFGMLCSGKELGINEDAAGIMEFLSHIKEGTPLDLLYSDTILDVALTPNLSHCTSIYGVARELSSLTGIPLKKNSAKELVKFETAPLQIKIENSQNCLAYSCCLIESLSQEVQTPQWLQERLELCGLRSVNPVVDVTNYVLLEYGHPLHAFDMDLWEGSTLFVRDAKEGESVTLLDGKTKELFKEDLVIADEKKVTCIAGVMGCQNSEVGPTTKRILLESAYFQPQTIRKTSKRHGMQTDASKRFERGVDPNQILLSLQRASELILQICGGTLTAGAFQGNASFPEKKVTCRLSKINALLGVRLSVNEIETLFTRLFLRSVFDGTDLFTVQIPTYRCDLNQEIDLVEEVARLYGFENIRKKQHTFTSSITPHTPAYTFEREVRDHLLLEGLQEFLTCDLMSQKEVSQAFKLGVDKASCVKVLNPVSQDQSQLRPSLLPGLLKVVQHNFSHQIKEISAFEIGRLHFQQQSEGKTRYLEPLACGIVLTGKGSPHHFEKKPQEVTFFDLKGILENLFSSFFLENVVYSPGNLPFFHPGRQAVIQVGEIQIGAFGEVHPEVLRAFDLPQSVLLAEVNLQDLMSLRQEAAKKKPLPLYPGSQRDWTLTLSENVSAQEVFQAIKKAQSSLLEDVTLQDVYRSEKLGTGLKNLTFRFFYRELARTLEQKEVDQEQLRVQENVENELLKSTL